MIRKIITFFLRNIINLLNLINRQYSLKFQILVGLNLSKIFQTKINKTQLYFYAENEHCLKRYNSLLYKEEKTIKWLNQIKKNETLWDIGANIGIYSIYAAKIRKANVVSFEPMINSSYVLNKNLEINNLEKKIIILPLALDRAFKIEKLYFNSNHAGSARHSLKKRIFLKNKFVNILTINSSFFLKKKILKYPNHIKIDTDGNEVTILKNFQEFLINKYIKSICIEVEYGKKEKINRNKIKKIMSKNGFFLKDTDVLTAGYNLFFYKKKLLNFKKT